MSNEPSSPDPTRAPRPDAEERLAEARKKLRAALDGLDSALILQAERARDQADQRAEYAALQEDRTRLAQEIEARTARLRALDAASAEALARVERASAAVRAVLAAEIDANPAQEV